MQILSYSIFIGSQGGKFEILLNHIQDLTFIRNNRQQNFTQVDTGINNNNSNDKNSNDHLIYTSTNTFIKLSCSNNQNLSVTNIKPSQDDSFIFSEYGSLINNNKNLANKLLYNLSDSSFTQLFDELFISY